MQVHELLNKRKAEIVDEIARLQAELNDIERMLAVSSAPVTQGKVTPTGVAVPATKDEAILQAIGNGCRTPAAISQFMRDRLGIQVNDGSTRTRLSRMKSDDKIAHDGSGWKLKD